jgi:2-(1,2-epoxy-1,2-dihydrophenyl)acetyl-CoA isomerase
VERPILTAVHESWRSLTFNRPDKLNAFTAEMNLELQAALDAVAADKTCRALLITAAGRGFTAGQDLGAIQSGAKRTVRETLEDLYDPIVKKLAALPCPTIVAVNGIAAGAGLNLALGCDLVLAGRSAKFLQPFSKIALIPDGGGTWHLPRLVGAARARALAMLAEPVAAEDAAAMGMIWKVVDDEMLQAEAAALAQRVAAMPTEALVAIRKTLAAAETNTLEQQLKLECEVQESLSGKPDNREGIAAFMEKRAARFMGRSS